MSGESAGGGVAAAPAPEEVARKFVKAYYQRMSDDPDVLYRFYRPESQASYAFLADESSEPHRGEGLRQHLAAFLGQHIKGRKVSLAGGSVDAQRLGGGASDSDSVFVMVTGAVDGAETARRFVQTLHLVRMGRSYYVLNDMFRFSDTGPQLAPGGIPASEPVTPAPVPMAAPASGPSASPAPPPPPAPNAVFDASLTSPPLVPPRPVVEDIKAEAEAEIRAEEGPGPTPPPTPATPGSNGVPQPAEAAAAAAAEPSGPVSWAKIACKGGGPMTVSKGLSPTRKPRPSSRATPKAEDAEPASGPGARRLNGDNHGKPSAPRVMNPGIYIRNVHASATDEEMTALFSGPWGKVVRVISYAPKGYAFIEFSTSEAVQAVLSGEVSDEWMLKDQTLVVEERRDTKERGTLHRRRSENGYSGRGRRESRGGRGGRGRGGRGRGAAAASR